ncbi:MAG: shikimate kinase [Candidatus Onthomonas sp.]|nr:shikimate kinase [Candidatus Onthomonas sp.]
MKNKEDKNIILIGMSGAGKSTLGVLLAKALGMDFVDTDILIQQREKRLLQEIIDREGIEQFLRTEEAVLSELQVRNCVVATGGSAVYSRKAMQSLRETGTVIYLSVPYEEVEKRVTNITTRGIVIKQGRSLKDAYEERLPLYRQYSDVVIDCAGRDIEGSVGEMIAKLCEAGAVIL